VESRDVGWNAASRTRADYRVSDAAMRHAGDVTATERRKYGCRRGVPSGRSMTPDDIFAIATYTDCHDRNRDREISDGVNPQTEQEGFHAKILLPRYVHIRITRKIDDPDMFSSRTHQDAIFLGLIAPFIRDKNRSLFQPRARRGNIFRVSSQFSFASRSCGFRIKLSRHFLNKI